MSRAQASDASDASLLARTRDGDESAYAELWLRHSAAGLTVARSVTSSLDHDDLVQEAFVRVFTAVRKGGGPKGAFRPYLFTTLRNTAAEWGRKKRETSLDTLESFEDPSTSDAATEAALDRGLTAKAYRSLPTRWQEVLWYSEVEQMTPAEVAPLLGMTANSVAALAYRAREGLRQAWIQAHINSVAAGSECRWTLERMGSYARSALGKRDTLRFDNHLDECAKCTIVVAEAKAVGSRIALVLLPLTIGATGASAYLAWLQSGQTAAVMAMPASVAAGVGASTAAGAGAGVAASGGSGSAGGGAGAGAGSAASGLSAGAIAVGGTVLAGVLAAAVAAAVIFIPALLPGGEANPTSPPQAASQPPALDDPDEDAAPNDDATEDAPPADDPPAKEYSPPPADDPPVEDPPAEAPPADDSDESAPPAESDNETIAPDAPPVTPTNISVTPGDGTADPVLSGVAEPGSTITATVEPAGTASTASAGVSAPALSSVPSAASLTSPSAVPASLTSSFAAAEQAASAPPLTTKANSDGAWRLTLSDLEPGDYSVTVTARIGGRTSAPSDAVTVSVPAPDGGEDGGDDGDGSGDPGEPRTFSIDGVAGHLVSDDSCDESFFSLCFTLTSLTVDGVVPGDDVTIVITFQHEGAPIEFVGQVDTECQVGQPCDVTFSDTAPSIPWMFLNQPRVSVDIDGVRSDSVRIHFADISSQ